MSRADSGKAVAPVMTPQERDELLAYSEALRQQLAVQRELISTQLMLISNGQERLHSRWRQIEEEWADRKQRGRPS